MSEFFVNTNNYGLILLRNSYEEARAESEEMYDKQCERKRCPTPKSERQTTPLLGIKENVLSGQIGLFIPPRHPDTQVPVSAIRAEHVDNPLWINYDFLNGESKMVLGALPFGQFGLGIVNPKEVRKILEGNFSQDLIRPSERFKSQIHSRSSWASQRDYPRVPAEA